MFFDDPFGISGYPRTRSPHNTFFFTAIPFTVIFISPCGVQNRRGTGLTDLLAQSSYAFLKSSI